MRGLSRRQRTIRYGAGGALVLAGVACGILVPGTAGGTLATVLVGLGLVLAVSLVFYEVGLTEDRDRATDARRDERPQHPPQAHSGEHPHHPPQPRSDQPEVPHDLHDPPPPHRPVRRRPLGRMRGERRRLR